MVSNNPSNNNLNLPVFTSRHINPAKGDMAAGTVMDMVSGIGNDVANFFTPAAYADTAPQAPTIVYDNGGMPIGAISPDYPIPAQELIDTVGLDSLVKGIEPEYATGVPDVDLSKPITPNVPQMPEQVQPQMPIQQTNVQNVLPQETPTLSDMIYQAQAEVQPKRLQELQQMNQVQGNFIDNVGQDAQALAGGVLQAAPLLMQYPSGVIAQLMDNITGNQNTEVTDKYFGDAKNVSNTINNELAKWYLGTDTEQKVGDIANLLVGGLSGEQYADVIKNKTNPLPYLAKNLYNRPVTTGLDIASLGLAGAGTVGRVGKATTNILGQANEATKIAKAAKPTEIAVANTAKAHQEAMKAVDTLEDIRKYSEDDIAQVLKSFEETGVSNIPNNLKELGNKLATFQKEWKAYIEKAYPYATMLDDTVATAAQYLVRKVGIPYHEAAKKVSIAFDRLKESNTNIKLVHTLLKGVDPKNIIATSKGADLVKGLDASKLNQLGKELLEHLKKQTVILVDFDAHGRYIKPTAQGSTRAIKAPIVMCYDMMDRVNNLKTLFHEAYHSYITAHINEPVFKKMRIETLAANKALSDFLGDSDKRQQFELAVQHMDIAGRNPLTPNAKGMIEIKAKYDLPKQVENLQDIVKEGVKVYADYHNCREERTARLMGENFSKQKMADTFELPTNSGIDTLDDIEPEVLEALNKAESGELKYFTHADAETADKIADVIDDGSDMIKYAGKASDRVLGNASYKAIAHSVKHNREWLHRNIMARNQQLNKETLLSEAAKPLNDADTVYVSKGQIEKAVTTDNIVMSPTPTTVDSIPVSKKFVQDMQKHQEFLADTNPYRKGSIMADLWSLTKSVALGSGLYLSGNAATGATNAIINSGALLPVDIAQALGSKGSLLKNLGTFRDYQRVNTNVHNPVLQGFERTNRPISNTFNVIDANIQNFFGEVAAHNKLRTMGVPYKNRVNKIVSLTENEQQKLAEIVNDINRTALIMDGTSIVPREWRGLVGVTSGQFWRWNEQAALSALHMYKKHPMLMNIAVNHILANLGHDLEMQNRLNLNIDKDVPNAHLKIDQRTGDVKEVQAEVLPIMNTLNLGYNLGQALSGKGKPEDVFNSAQPLAMVLVNAFEGKNQYGKPIKRDDAWVDYKTNTRFVSGKEVKSPYMDEILTTVVKNLSVYPKLYNSTIAPTLYGLQGKNFYQPYENSLFGSPDPTIDANILQSANPEKPTTPDAQLSRLMGMHESKYYDRDFKMGKRDMMRMLRGKAKQRSKRNQEINRYLRGE